MQMRTIIRTASRAQAAQAMRLPRFYVEIAGSTAELNDPRSFICEAVRVLTAGVRNARSPTSTAKKANALLIAASLKAQRAGSWSVSMEYDPAPDFLRLRDLARKLGRPRGATHPLTQLQSGIEDTLAILSGKHVG